MSDLKLQHLDKIYDNKVQAVYDFNLDVKDGELIVLVGPSGCGKSTVLRLICGLEGADSGSIYIGDRLVNDVPPASRGIAMVFQSYALYPHMTVFENMSFALQVRKLKKDEINRRVLEAAKILKIDHLLDRKPKELSGGQRQRVAIGRAIVRNPFAFLFDEPLSNLDYSLRCQMRYELAKLKVQLKTTMVYVTHDQSEAMTLADKIVVMRDGIIEQTGTPMEIYNSPANIFVARFVGSSKMNTCPVVFTGMHGKLANFQLDNDETIAIRKDLNLVKGQKYILGIRPEHLEIMSEQYGENILSGTVALVEDLGGEGFVHVNIGGDVQLTAKIQQKAEYKAGSKVCLTFRYNYCYLFQESGEAVCGILPLGTEQIRAGYV